MVAGRSHGTESLSHRDGNGRRLGLIVTVYYDSMMPVTRDNLNPAGGGPGHRLPR